MPIATIAGNRHGAEVRARQHQILMGVPPRGKDEARGGDQDEHHRQNANQQGMWSIIRRSKVTAVRRVASPVRIPIQTDVDGEHVTLWVGGDA